MRFIPGMQGWFNILISISVVHYRNIMKDKDLIITSIHAEKMLEKVQYIFITKTL